MNGSPPRGAPQRLRAGVAELFPGYFALVMATGIVSIAAHLLGWSWIARALLWVNLVAYPVLWLLTLARLLLYPRRLWADLTDHGRGPGFFTLVAGTCVLGNQLAVVAGAAQPARWLWLLALALWLPIMYTFLAAVTVRQAKPPVERGLSGAWLLMVVAVQSLAALGALLAPRLAQEGGAGDALLFAALCFFLLGCLLYIIIITIIFYRFTFFVFDPAALTPPYWINMGAVAITTLAGATLILNAGGLPLLGEALPFLKGFTLLFWTTATWWIPLLFILGFWRHGARHFPLRYDPQYWGMVFPLGMYATCTYRLSQALALPFLLPLALLFLGLALLAWLGVMGGMVAGLASRFAQSGD